jgi:hypothetical protein
MPLILASQEAEIRRIVVQGQPQHCETLSQKYLTQNRTGRVVEVIECLPSKHEALNSNPSTKKKKSPIHCLPTALWAKDQTFNNWAYVIHMYEVQILTNKREACHSSRSMTSFASV